MERLLAAILFAALVGAAYHVFLHLRHKRRARDAARDTRHE